MGKKQVTFADIAEYTHFSKTTISRYFNHPDSLTLENQEKISRALDELGYKKNKLAKVLANGKSEFVGIKVILELEALILHERPRSAVICIGIHVVILDRIFLLRHVEGYLLVYGGLIFLLCDFTVFP